MEDNEFGMVIAGLVRKRAKTGPMCLMLALAMAGAANRVPQFSLADTAGRTHTPQEWSGKRAVVLFFLTTDCPLCNNYVPELNRIAQEFSGRGVAFYGVQGDATIPDADVRQHSKDFAYTFPYLLDPDESLATYTGATSTPEAAVLSPSGELLYLGRIDNRLEDFGKQRVQVTEFDLRDALQAVLNGKPVPHARTKALGCAIVRKG
jgi:peroxiredoxin